MKGRCGAINVHVFLLIQKASFLREACLIQFGLNQITGIFNLSKHIYIY